MVCYSSEIHVPKDGTDMYSSSDVTFNYRVSYIRVKRSSTVIHNRTRYSNLARLCKDSKRIQLISL